MFVEDQEKCLSLLQKESERHYHPSQPFPDFRLPENKINAIRNDYAKQFVQDGNVSSSSSVNLQHLYIPTDSKNVSKTSGRSRSHGGIVHLSRNSLNQRVSSNPKPFSAPVINNSEQPFKDIYSQSLVSSQATCQLPSSRDSQFIFHTTKNHIIEAPDTHESTAYLSVSGEPEQSRKHAVKLSITPSFPFHQQHINVFNNSIYTTASHSSRFDRHTTSVNFHLQPQTSSQFPLEIATIPTNIGQQCDSKDFCSHVQISVGEQGTTFTAVRLQHPNYLPTENAPRLPVAEVCTPSSQVLNSNLSSFSNRRVHLLPDSGTSQSFKYPVSVSFDQNQNHVLMIQPNPQMNSIPSYRSLHDNAIKNQQIAQLDAIFNELEKEKSICTQLRTDVNKLEEKVIKRSAETSIPAADELEKLREEIKILRAEVTCLSVEVDRERIVDQSQAKVENKSTREDEDEKNQWSCENCTFYNHPALEKCEMCELPKNSGAFFGGK